MDNKSNGIGALQLVLLTVFITLKLTGNIGWSWWAVTSPLWLPVVLIPSAVVAVAFFIAIYKIFKK